MARPVSRNNVIAGLFVVATMLLAIGISIAVSGVQKRLTPTQPYIIRFTLLEGAAGLKPGSPVNLGGQEVGRVISLEFARDAAQRPAAIDAHVRINSSITLFQDAWAFLERPLLGSMSAINLSRVGGDPDPQSGAVAPPLQPGGVLAGVMAPPTFLAQAGYGPDQVRQFRAMIQQAGTVVDRIDRLSSQFESGEYKNIKSALDDLSAFTSEFRQKAPGWTQKADSILAQTDDAAGRLKPLADQISGTVSNADKVIKDLQSAVNENRPGLDRIIANIDDAAKRIETESLPALNDTLKKSNQGAASFSDAGQRFNALIQEQTPNLRTMIGNLRLAADQVKLTMVEVRRNPWRLLYTPKTKELESELFYDAARTYAEAVSDLKAASEALEITTHTDGAGGSAVDRESINHIVSRLDEAFERYKSAEKELLKKMVEKRP